MNQIEVTVKLDEQIYDFLKREAEDIGESLETHIASLLYQRNIESRLFAKQMDEMVMAAKA